MDQENLLQSMLFLFMIPAVTVKLAVIAIGRPSGTNEIATETILTIRATDVRHTNHSAQPLRTFYRDITWVFATNIGRPNDDDNDIHHDHQRYDNHHESQDLLLKSRHSSRRLIR